MITRDDILNQAYQECIVELFKWSQPSIDINELIKNGYKDDGEIPLYRQHYLSQSNFRIIQDRYMSAYGIIDTWDETFDTIKNQLLNGGIEDDYKKGTLEKPAYRDYKKVLPLKEVISNPKDIDTVIEYIEKCQNFFKGHCMETNRFNMSTCLGCSPTTNPKEVEIYWQHNGRPDFKIKEFNVDDVIYGGINDEYVDISEEEFINTLK